MSSFSGGQSSGGTLIGDIMPFYVNGYMVTANQPLTGALTPNGGTANNGEVVFLGGQTNPVENGLWVVNTGGAWSRYSLYTGSAALKSPIICVSPTTTVKYATFRYTGSASPIIIGTTSLVYGFDAYEGGSSSINIRALTAAGDSAINFMANGAGFAASAAAYITRLSGVNGGFSIFNSGNGNFSLGANGHMDITPLSTFSLMIHPNLSAGYVYIGGAGSQLGLNPSIVMQSTSVFSAGFSCGVNRITAGSASSVNARQLQVFFDPPGAAIASYTVTLPGSGSLIDGQEMLIHAGAFGVTALTLTPGSGTTIRGAITTLATDGFARYKYITAITTWVRIG